MFSKKALLVCMDALSIKTTDVSPGWTDSLQKAQGNLPIRSVRVAREGG